MERSSSKKWVVGIISFAAGALLFAGVHALIPHSSDHSTHTESGEINGSQLSLYQDMRKLWADHVFWTREYIVSAIDENADLEFATERLLKNQEDIGQAIVPYYGQAAGDRLTELLKEHIFIAVDLVAAAKTDDQEKFSDANEKWYQNASDISAFLSGANSNWPEEALVEAMNMHLETTTDEAVARLTKDYERDVAAFDAVFDHMMHMSDTLASGIVAQFPEKF